MPVIGEEIGHLADGCGGNAGEHIAEISQWLNFMSLTGCDNAEQCCGGAAAVVRTGEEPVLAADGHAAQGVLAGIVIDVQSAVGGING